MLHENSLYTNQAEKDALLKDKHKIADALLFGYFGYISMFAVIPRKDVKEWKSVEQQVRLDKIGDTNTDVSLTVKLAVEANLITRSTADKLTKLLALFKQGKIVKAKDVDDDRIHELFMLCKFDTSNKPSAQLLDIVDQYVKREINIAFLARDLYKKSRLPGLKDISEEFRVMFKNANYTGTYLSLENGYTKLEMGIPQKYVKQITPKTIIHTVTNGNVVVTDSTGTQLRTSPVVAQPAANAQAAAVPTGSGTGVAQVAQAVVDQTTTQAAAAQPAQPATNVADQTPTTTQTADVQTQSADGTLNTSNITVDDKPADDVTTVDPLAVVDDQTKQDEPVIVVDPRYEIKENDDDFDLVFGESIKEETDYKFPFKVDSTTMLDEKHIASALYDLRHGYKHTAMANTENRLKEIEEIFPLDPLFESPEAFIDGFKKLILNNKHTAGRSDELLSVYFHLMYEKKKRDNITCDFLTDAEFIEAKSTSAVYEKWTDEAGIYQAMKAMVVLGLMQHNPSSAIFYAYPGYERFGYNKRFSKSSVLSGGKKVIAKSLNYIARFAPRISLKDFITNILTQNKRFNVPEILTAVWGACKLLSIYYTNSEDSYDVSYDQVLSSFGLHVMELAQQHNVSLSELTKKSYDSIVSFYKNSYDDGSIDVAYFGNYYKMEGFSKISALAKDPATFSRLEKFGNLVDPAYVIPTDNIFDFVLNGRMGDLSTLMQYVSYTKSSTMYDGYDDKYAVDYAERYFKYVRERGSRTSDMLRYIADFYQNSGQFGKAEHLVKVMCDVLVEKLSTLSPKDINDQFINYSYRYEMILSKLVAHIPNSPTRDKLYDMIYQAEIEQILDTEQFNFSFNNFDSKTAEVLRSVLEKNIDSVAVKATEKCSAALQTLQSTQFVGIYDINGSITNIRLFVESISSIKGGEEVRDIYDKLVDDFIESGNIREIGYPFGGWRGNETSRVTFLEIGKRARELYDADNSNVKAKQALDDLAGIAIGRQHSLAVLYDPDMKLLFTDESRYDAAVKEAINRIATNDMTFEDNFVRGGLANQKHLSPMIRKYIESLYSNQLPIKLGFDNPVGIPGFDALARLLDDKDIDDLFDMDSVKSMNLSNPTRVLDGYHKYGKTNSSGLIALTIISKKPYEFINTGLISTILDSGNSDKYSSTNRMLDTLKKNISNTVIGDFDLDKFRSMNVEGRKVIVKELVKTDYDEIVNDNVESIRTILNKSPYEVHTDLDNDSLIKIGKINGVGLSAVVKLAEDVDVDSITSKDQLQKLISETVRAAVVDDIAAETVMEVGDRTKDKQKLIEASIELYDTCNGRHGDIAPIVHEIIDINMDRSRLNAFIEKDKLNPKSDTKGKTRKMMFHGTGSIATTFISKFGFRDIPSGFGIKVAGKMLGNGIYLAEHCDKSLSYIGDGGYTKAPKMGYLFEVEVCFGEYGVDYMDGRGRNLLAPEWCIKNFTDQIVVTKIYKLESAPTRKYKSYVE